MFVHTKFRIMDVRNKYCSQTSAVYRITCCEKTYLSLNPVAVTLVPPVMTASELIARSRCLEFQFGISFEKITVLFQ